MHKKVCPPNSFVNKMKPFICGVVLLGSLGSIGLASAEEIKTTIIGKSLESNAIGLVVEGKLNAERTPSGEFTHTHFTIAPQYVTGDNEEFSDETLAESAKNGKNATPENGYIEVRYPNSPITDLESSLYQSKEGFVGDHTLLIKERYSPTDKMIVAYKYGPRKESEKTLAQQAEMNLDSPINPYGWKKFKAMPRYVEDSAALQHAFGGSVTGKWVNGRGIASYGTNRIAEHTVEEHNFDMQDGTVFRAQFRDAEYLSGSSI